MGELARLVVLRDLDQQRLKTEAAAQLLEFERGQLFRLLKAYRAEGATDLISKRRGYPSNSASPRRCGKQRWALVRERYWGFGPTPACAEAGFWWRRS